MRLEWRVEEQGKLSKQIHSKVHLAVLEFSSLHQSVDYMMFLDLFKATELIFSAQTEAVPGVWA